MNALEKYKQWVFLMQQIHEASYYIRRSEELGHPQLWTSYSHILEFIAHFKSALNAYAKCFVSAGRGRIKLDAPSVFRSSEDHLAQHDVIINLRHKYVAHSDTNQFELATVLEEDTPEELILRLQYKLSFPFDRLYELRKLIRLVEAHVVDRQKTLIAAIEREAGKPVRIQEGNDEKI